MRLAYSVHCTLMDDWKHHAPIAARLSPIEVRGGRPDDTSFLFHCLVPAGKWWNDILFT